MISFQKYLKENQMLISAALILTDGNVILGCRPTGSNNRLDLPKGLIEKNESPIEACVRETREETNIKINKTDLKDHKIFNYIKTKQLHVFSLKLDILPSINIMKCTSYFTDKSGNEMPEVNGYRYVNIDNIQKYFHPKIVAIIIKLKNSNEF